MSSTLVKNHPGRRLFEEDFQKLRANVVKPTGYFKELYDLMVEHSTVDRETPDRRRWYVPSSVMLGLLDGSKEAIVKARAEFLIEWQDGYSLNKDATNDIHYWNSHAFKVNDRWISAAMLVQLLILWDWLAEAGAWSEAEIDEHAEMALGVLEVFIESHLKGRGHMPILHDPINQGAAMSTGLLYAGYLFGTKWRQDARGIRMYGRAKNLLPDHIGQFLKSGYDGDGFTYLRFIHLQCFTLGLALLEDVEGGDWYHRRFAPNDISLAWLNERQFDFITPSGCTWPLGRYGYVKSWNLFNLSYAAKRTGDPRYLQTARRDNAEHDYNSPWLRMEIPLGLLWYPEALNQAITEQDLSIQPVKECVPDTWAVFYEPGSRMQAIFLWMQGKVPHFILEAEGTPLLPGGGNAWSEANGVQPGNFDYEAQGWMLPAGKLIRYGDLPGCSAVAVETTGAYPPKAEVTYAARTVFQLKGLMVVSDRFSSARPDVPFWQTRVIKGSSTAGKVATLAGYGGVKGRLASVDGELSLTPSGLKRLEHKVLGGIETDMLKITGSPGDSAFDIALSWDSVREPAISRERDDLLKVQDGAETLWLLLPSHKPEALRRIGHFETDATMAVWETSEGRLSLFGARIMRDETGERFWSDVPLNAVIAKDRLAVENLGYGNFLSYRAPGTVISLKRGNGMEIYARAPKNFELRVKGQATGVIVNDVPMEGEDCDGWKSIAVAAWKQPGSDLAALLKASLNADSDTLIPVLNQIRAAMLVESAPLVREFLTWDGSATASPRNPLATESSHVRMEVARTLACLGDVDSIDALIDLVERELKTIYNRNSKWGSQFFGSSARVVAIEALIFLHAIKFLPVIDRIKPEEGVPHVQDILIRAREILSTP